MNRIKWPSILGTRCRSALDFLCLRFYLIQLILGERGVSHCLRKYAGACSLCSTLCCATINQYEACGAALLYKQIRSTPQFRLRYQFNSIANVFLQGCSLCHLTIINQCQAKARSSWHRK